MREKIGKNRVGQSTLEFAAVFLAMGIAIVFIGNYMRQGVNAKLKNIQSSVTEEAEWRGSHFGGSGGGSSDDGWEERWRQKRREPPRIKK